jgi:hypothetical protein
MATRNVILPVLVASLVSLAGLTGCSSSSDADDGLSPLWDKWEQTLDDQMSATNQVCASAISVDCVNNIEAVMVVLRDIRRDIAKASASAQYTDLEAALDQADKDHQTFTDENCATGGAIGCPILVADISQDVTRILNELA